MKKKILNLRGILETTNKVYLPYYNNKSRYLVIYGGAGSGKSRFIGQKILVRTLLEKKHRFLIVRKVDRTLKRSVWTLITDYIYRYNLDRFFNINKTEKIITCTLNNNSILFLGLDDREKLKSIEGITGIWAEEASELDYEDFLQLDLRLRGHTENYKQFILSFNPISSKHWLKKHFFDRKVEDLTILKTTYKDNKFIDAKYVEVLEDLKNTNYNYYKIYALGEWGELKGKIFNEYIEIEEYPDTGINDEAYGVDFGTANPSAVVRCGINYDKREIYLDEYLYEAELTREELAKKVKNNYPELLKLLGYGDSAEPHSIKTFKKMGFKMVGAKKDTLASIDFLKSYTIFITNRSYNLKTEWDSYRWKVDKHGEIIDEPIKENDHAIDAVRYCTFTRWGVKEANKIKSENTKLKESLLTKGRVYYKDKLKNF